MFIQLVWAQSERNALVSDVKGTSAAEWETQHVCLDVCWKKPCGCERINQTQ